MNILLFASQFCHTTSSKTYSFSKVKSIINTTIMQQGQACLTPVSDLKTSQIFLSKILPVSPFAVQSGSPLGRRRFHRLKFHARRLELAQTQTPLPGASPAPHWWSSHPSSHPMSSIWQPFPETHKHTHTGGRRHG